MSTAFIFIYITCPNKNLARKISKELLNKKLMACANIISGMESLYRWDGRICQDKEIILLLKTRKSNFTKIEKIVKSMHSYDCPCIVSLPILSGEKNYLNWIDSNC